MLRTTGPWFATVLSVVLGLVQKTVRGESSRKRDALILSEITIRQTTITVVETRNKPVTAQETW